MLTCHFLWLLTTSWVSLGELHVWKCWTFHPEFVRRFSPWEVMKLLEEWCELMLQYSRGVSGRSTVSWWERMMFISNEHCSLSACDDAASYSFLYACQYFLFYRKKAKWYHRVGLCFTHHPSYLANFTGWLPQHPFNIGSAFLKEPACKSHTLQNKSYKNPAKLQPFRHLLDK